MFVLNLRRLSNRETNSRQLRRSAERVAREKWEVVLITELTLEKDLFV